MSIFANVYTGTFPNDGTGTALRDAFQIIDQNFANITNITSQVAGVTAIVPPGLPPTAGRSGNVYLSVNDVLGAASTGYVNDKFELYSYGDSNVGLYLPSDSTITSLQSDITAANSAIITANSAVVSYINATIEPLATNVASLINSENNIPGIITNVTALQINAAIQGTQINSLLANDASVTSSINSLNALVVNLTANSATQATQINDLQIAVIDIANTDVGVLTSRVENLESNSVTVSAQISNLNNEVNLLFANDAISNSQITTLIANAATQQQSINFLMTANTAEVAIEINNINSTLSAATIDITQLYANAAIQGTAINGLRANITAANAAIVLNNSTWRSNAAGLYNSIQAIAANDAVQFSSISATNANVTVANARIATQAGQITSLNSNVTAANTAIITANAAMTVYVNSLVNPIEANTGNILNAYNNLDAAMNNIELLFDNVNTINGNISTVQSSINVTNANVAAANVAIQLVNANVASVNASMPNLALTTTNIIPTVSNAYSLGSTTRFFKNLYVGGDAVLGSNLRVQSYIVTSNLITATTEATRFQGNSMQIFYTAVIGNLIVGNIQSNTGFSYTMGNSVNWSPSVSTVSSALDQLSATVQALKSTQYGTTGQITFDNYTISTQNDLGGNFGITLSPANGGEVHVDSYTGINNNNPGYWLHVGDGAPGAINNTGNISIDFNNGTDAAKASTIIDYAWWDSASRGNDNRGTGPHTHFGIYKNDDSHDSAYIEFDVTSGNASVGNLIATGSVTMGNTVINNGITTTTLTLSSAIQFANLTTTQITAIASPARGMTVYNYTTGNVQVYNGTKWANVVLS